MKAPIVIVGMARSGTTLVSHLLGCSPGVYCEIEPHILWKSGSLSLLGDDEFTDDVESVSWIRKKLLSNVGDKVLVEKSPPNCLRPSLVHSVFPDAKIVYVERDPTRCIDSNYKRSLSSDSLKLSIIVKKYLVSSGSSDLAGAIGKRKLHQQLRLSEMPSFLIYFIKMLYLRSVKKLLPFGPKLRGYSEYVEKHGLLSYHVKVYLEARGKKCDYQAFYGDRLRVFKLEDFQNDLEEVKKLYDFCDLPIDDSVIQFAAKSINKERVIAASQEGERDREIRSLIDKVNAENNSGCE